MKLTYRGVTYEHQPVTLETTPTQEVAGKYRGRDWRFRNLEKPPVIIPITGLTYRGVSYDKPGSLTKQVDQGLKVSSIQNKARSLMFSHARTIKKRQQSMLARAATAIGLDERASGYLNRIQGKIHPTFRLNYDRFGATMS